jgi:hypothetical protein
MPGMLPQMLLTALAQPLSGPQPGRVSWLKCSHTMMPEVMVATSSRMRQTANTAGAMTAGALPAFCGVGAESCWAEAVLASRLALPLVRDCPCDLPVLRLDDDLRAMALPYQ